MPEEVNDLFFLDRMRPLFSAAVRHKGEAYVSQGLIDMRSLTHKKIEATVSGTYQYQVEINIRKDSKIEMSCTCPHFLDSGENCKHLWAAIVEVSRNWRSFALNNKNKKISSLDLQEEKEPKPYCIHNHPLFIHSFQKDRDWRVLLSESETKEKIEPKESSSQKFYPFFIIDRELSLQQEQVVLKIEERYLKKCNIWGRARYIKYEPHRPVSERYNDMSDQKAMELIFSLKDRREYSNTSYYHTNEYNYNDRFIENISLPGSIAWALLPILAATDRLYLGLNEIDKTNCLKTIYREIKLRLSLDDAWHCQITLVENEDEDSYHLCPTLIRRDQSISLTEPDILFSGDPHWFIYQGMIYQICTRLPSLWLKELRKPSPIIVEQAELSEFFEDIHQQETCSFFDIFILPSALKFTEIRGMIPKPELYITFDKQLWAHLKFRYSNNYLIDSRMASEVINDFGRQVRICRDPTYEESCFQKLQQLGFQKHNHPDFEWRLEEGGSLKVLQELIENEQWAILGSEHKKVRFSSGFKFIVASGIDWFSLDGEVVFDGQQGISLIDLWERYKKGERFILLGDGSLGLLPEEWLKQYNFVFQLGKRQTDQANSLRFSIAQVGLLDLVLNSGEKVSFDERYLQIRDQLQNFQGIKPVHVPSEFQGTLRPYQKKGLDWLIFLNEFEFGGCLADDMGLGKTVQVLAMLEYMRNKGVDIPSIVVVPTSLVSNWQKEAQRFTPYLRVLAYVGAQRGEMFENFNKYDVIITTYGTLRRDILLLHKCEFYYLILDEAQVIKNHQTQIAKSCLLLKAKHRLSMTGTPLENHLGELWSQFKFLNSSLLGSYEEFIRRFRDPIVNQNKTLDADQPIIKTSPDIEPLRRLVYPFLLRRTKADVEPQLPGKVEQIVYCDMTEEQRTIYDHFKDLYRAGLMKMIDRTGLGSSKFKILEALLRLRQICCHPIIISSLYQMEGETSSGKFMAFQEMLENVIKEGHKALIFSQFTTMLRIIRRWLDKNEIYYQYLDGHVRDRDIHINKFQEDKDCRIFLISLKAGGFGLNLTAADYVFLYDPWWNPAVEAQAIDRTHRIGQDKKVFTYRLITKDSVEEKIQKLQAQKQGLVQSIIHSGDSLLHNLTKDDILALFS